MTTDGRRNNGRHRRSHEDRVLGARTGQDQMLAAKLTTEGRRRRIEWLRSYSERLHELLRSERER